MIGDEVMNMTVTSTINYIARALPTKAKGRNRTSATKTIMTIGSVSARVIGDTMKNRVNAFTITNIGGTDLIIDTMRDTARAIATVCSLGVGWISGEARNVTSATRTNVSGTHLGTTTAEKVTANSSAITVIIINSGRNRASATDANFCSAYAEDITIIMGVTEIVTMMSAMTGGGGGDMITKRGMNSGPSANEARLRMSGILVKFVMTLQGGRTRSRSQSRRAARS